MTIETKLQELGLTLPEPSVPVAAYIPAVRVGDMVYVSGQLPFVDGELKYNGKAGAEISIEDAQDAARICALNCLAALTTVANIADIRKIVKVTGFVAAGPDFYNHPQVINGASEFLQYILGDAGKHARAAVGVSALPLNAPVEVEMIVQI